MNKSLRLVTSSLASALVLSASAFADGNELDKLKSDVNALNQRIQQLENKPAGMGGSETGYVQKGNDKLWLKLSGQVSRAVLYAQTDDITDNNKHTNQDVFHVDSDASPTRFTLEGGKQINNDLSMGSVLEIQVEPNSSASVNFDTNEDTGVNTSDTISDRKAELFLKSNKWGTVWMGKGWMAAALTTSVDLSETDLALYSTVADNAGGLAFGKSTATGDTVTVGQAFSTLEAFGRHSRLRYDSPEYMGFIASASFAELQDWDEEYKADVALRYGQEFNGTKVAAAIGYARQDDETATSDFHSLTGSASVLLPSGWNFTLAAAHKDPAHNPAVTTEAEQSFWYAKVGYLFNPFSVGQTALAVDYTENSDVDGDTTLGDAGRDNSNSQAWGAGVVQFFDSIATQGFLVFRNYEHDHATSSVDCEDIQIVELGFRTKF